MTSTLGCSGKLNPGKVSEGLSETPTPAPGSGGPDGDAGGGGGGGGISVPPVVTLINLKGGEVIAGGQPYRIFFTVHDAAIGFNEVKIEYRRDGDTDWKIIADRLATLSDVETYVDWPVCPQSSDARCVGQTDGDGFRIRISAAGRDNLLTTETSPGTFSIDSSPPTLSATGLALKPGFPARGFSQLVLTGAQDGLSSVSEVCVKASDFTSPSPTDPCWNSIEAYGATKGPNPSAITITQYLGFFNGTYDFYVWIRDAAGNMTTMTLNDSSSPGVHKDAINVNYSYTNSPLWKDAAGDFTFNIDSSVAPSITIYTGVPGDDATTMTDPGSFVMNSKGQMIVNDKVQGLILVDLITRTRTSLVTLSSNTVEGTTGVGGTARLKNPLHIGVDEDDWIWIQDEETLAYIDSTGALKIAAGGGANTNDIIADPLDMRITYHSNLKWYGTFAVLPNKQIVFNSEDPHAALNPTLGTRFRLRVYHGKESGRIDSIAFSGSYNTNPVDNLVPYGSMAFTYDSTRKYIKDIVGRFCAEASGTCSDQLMLKFEAKGTNPTLLNHHSSWSNLTLRGSLETIYAVNSQKGLLSKLDMTSKSWSKVLGGTVRGTAYCNDNVPSTSCNVRLTDVFITKQNRVFFMDYSRLRSVEIDGRVQTLYNPEFDIANATTCKTLRAAGHTASGYYSIDPDNIGGAAPYTAYCDMTTDGGGWTLVARSALGGTGAFGWKTTAGDVTNDTQPFSFGATADTLAFTEMLFGNYTTAKTWGSWAYRWQNIPVGYLATYGASHWVNTPSTAPQAIIGGFAGFTMARYSGYTDSTVKYFFRDTTADASYGIYPNGWKTLGTAGGGNLDGLQGMLFVR